MWPTSLKDPNSASWHPIQTLFAWSSYTCTCSVPHLITRQWFKLFEMLSAVLEATQTQMRTQCDSGGKCKVIFRVVAILFCTKEDNAPVLHYSSALFYLIPRFLVPSILTGKCWLSEYLLSWPCVFSSRCWTKMWFETIQGLCSLQNTLKIVPGHLAANLFLPCWWPGLQAANV